MRLFQTLTTALLLISQTAFAQPEAGLILAGDAERGRLVFAQCRTCHYPEKIVGHNNGPNLANLFGRKAGSQPGFDYYSEDLKNSGIVWSPAILNAWLANPRTFLPNTTMVTLGVPDEQQRADLIAYLRLFEGQP
ncbi:MAG: c-type cytochrome [Endozoicomonas sp.]